MPWIQEKADVSTVVQRRWVELAWVFLNDASLFLRQAEQAEGRMEQEAPPAADAGDQGDQQGPQVMEDS